MPLKINQNQSVQQALRYTDTQQIKLNRSLERLSSGFKINRAADNAAGLAIALKLLTQSEGFSQAISNTADALNVSRTAESGLDQSGAILQRLRTLALQSANDTLTQSDREKIQIEVSELQDELTQVAQTTEFNTRPLLDGSLAPGSSTQDATSSIASNTRIGNSADLIAGIASTATDAPENVAFQLDIAAGSTPGSVEIRVSSSSEGELGSFQAGTGSPITQIDLTLGGNTLATLDVNASSVTEADIGKSALVQITPQNTGVPQDQSLSIQVGANEGQSLTLGFGEVSAQALELEGLNFVGTSDADSRLQAQNAIGTLDQALDKINSLRAEIGAFQNRLEQTLERLSISRENTLESASGIRDTDFAEESANLNAAQISAQTGLAALGQANVSSQSVLDLL